ncbi:MAG: tripartite tricarboxylate transporter substrate binding protein [Burkholderiaceae bacterium]|nr:tripartite tricarboxylate transporter substrate binding protein [Burkholderiaceae bacterium]
MKKMLRHVFALTGLLVTLAAAAPAAHAQEFPNRPITWTVGFAPGGISDQSTRFVAKVFAEKLGQQVVVDNKAGAGGIIASEHVAKAPADGYAILYGSSGPFGAFKSLYKKLPFDPLTSFTYIHGFGLSPLILVVPTNSPFKSLKDLVDFAKANPDKLTFGIFDYSIVVKPQIEAGKLRPLASTGAVRLTSHPDVPTATELGYPGVQLTAWAMIVGPAGMPQPVVDKMAKAFNEALKDPAVVKYHDDQGVTLMPDMQGARLREFVIKEQAKFKELVERSGATVQ